MPIDDSYQTALNLMRENYLSQFPILHHTSDKIVGVIPEVVSSLDEVTKRRLINELEDICQLLTEHQMQLRGEV